MKLFLINLGKAWSVLRREGVWRGGKRILLSGWNIVPRRLSGDILIISSGVGDSARYRGEHVAEELRLQGLRVAVTTQYNPFLSHAAGSFQVFIFHRTLFSGKVAQLVLRAKELGKTLIFETDDLVYDPEYITQTDLYRGMNVLERKMYEHGVGGEILADASVEVATTTTHFLAEKLRARGKRVFIVPNKLSRQDLAWAEKALDHQTSNIKHQTCVRIGYLSGTPSHNKDFATIIEPLKQILSTYEEVRLVLVGPLDTGSALAAFKDRIEIVPFVPRRQFFDVIAGLDINLAPLEIGNPFCEAKSELKFFEAGIVAVPTVAAATDTFRRAIVDGEDGFIAGAAEEWAAKLELLITDSEFRKSMGKAAETTALQKYSTLHAKNVEYYTYLRSKVMQ